MYNKFEKGLIGDNAVLNRKTYMQKKIVGVYADGGVDNTTGDTTEINLANKYANSISEVLA